MAEGTLDHVEPMPDCTRPNWLASATFPSRVDLTYREIFIGGPGARFHVLHYDNYHTHAFLMQLFGDKEYMAYGPDQTPFLYPNTTRRLNESQVGDGIEPDLTMFPLFEKARGIRFQLHSGETLFVPAGWWHTARILSPSITISINGANKANWKDFKIDYCACDSGQRMEAQEQGDRSLLEPHGSRPSDLERL